ncbi:TonB-dependent receptor domain-containing protein [Phocaeicola sp.]|uniref:TonB-dependent receptor domain-containing protein n=1 Tax=Phocaeicola sp. TaxID=2773926 RepID=UPI003A902935
MGAWVFRILITVIFCLKICQVGAREEKVTIRSVIERLKGKHEVMFVYDSSLDLNVACKVTHIKGKSLEDNLEEVFSGTDIKYEVKGSYVLLSKIRKYTLSGYVYQDNGEAVINATVWDITTGDGTLTDNHGFFSIMLREGYHKIRVSCIGAGENILEIDLKSNRMETVLLKSGYKLEEVVVVTDLNTPLTISHTGKESIKSEDFEKGIYFMSSPDVVAALHNMSGIASGAEPMSGLYVHGGNHDENQVVLDGAPLYHVNHVGGLFSAFNTDVVRNVDFYKSGFPARYGGRLSSVLDVRTRDGDMHEFHGKFALGLMDGRIQVEGPIIKQTTSFNVAIRRTWLNLVHVPLLDMISTKRGGGEKTTYLFHDINAKVSHIFSEKSRANICLYSGRDYVKIDDRHTYDEEERIEDERLCLRWGNVTASAHWEYIFSQKLFMSLSGIYTHSSSEYHYQSQMYSVYGGKKAQSREETRSNLSTIDDLGYRLEFDYSLNNRHRLRLGSNYVNHRLRPQDFQTHDSEAGRLGYDAKEGQAKVLYSGNELALFVEDEMTLNEKLRLNAGLRYNLFCLSRSKSSSLEPRLSFNYRVDRNTSLKASVTKMTQYMHKLSSTYLNIPIDCWVPSTNNTGYSYSWQFAAGIYNTLSDNLNMKVEGFYRTLGNLIEYSGINRLNPSAVDWESNVSRGKGESYGVEYDMTYITDKLGLDLSYTLSWNRRFFPDFHDEWFPDKFDNRHKLNISFNYKLHKNIEMYVLWRFHSGNRFTLPLQVVSSPFMPGDDIRPINLLIYEAPNNALLPAYHRLDCGMKFRKTTKWGLEQLWDVSLYNVYARRNTFYAEPIQEKDGTLGWKTIGGLPLFPSFCYTIKF